MIPVARPDIGPEEIAAVTEVLESGMLAGGRRVAELEDRWAGFIGSKHAIAVSNGTVALMAIFAALEVGPGDEVITVGHTFNATISAILWTGATPVFVDIEPDTYVMDARQIESAITPRTRAICPGPPLRPAGRPRHHHGDRANVTGWLSSRTPVRHMVPNSRVVGSEASGTVRSACTAPRT